MKVFIMLGIIFMLIIVNVQASTIMLKDGRTITGEIIQQDKAKVVVKEGDVSLTYYKDEITSIVEKPLIVKDNDTGSEAEKEKLVEQFMNYNPMKQIVYDWVQNNIRPARRTIVLSAEEKDIQELTGLRKKILMQDYSSVALKAAINFYSSAEGQEFLKNRSQALNDMVAKFNTELRKIANKVVKAAVEEEKSKNAGGS